MTRLLAAVFALGIPIATAADSDDWKPFAVTLEPARSHEECVRIEAGAKRRYHWKSDAPVDFNIHYHRDTEVLYPARNQIRGQTPYSKSANKVSDPSLYAGMNSSAAPLLQ